MTNGERTQRRFSELFAQLGARPVVTQLQPAVCSNVARNLRREDRAAGGVASEIWMEIFEERAAIMQHEGGMTKEDSEKFARAEAEKWANARGMIEDES